MVIDTTKDEIIRRRILLSTISNYAGKVFALGISFLLTPFVLRYLGIELYGLWVLVSSVVAYGGLLDFGISGGIAKYVAEYQARGQIQQARSFVATGLLLYAALGLIAMMLSIVLAVLFPVIFNISPAQRLVAMELVLLSGLGLGIAIPCSTPIAVLRGLQRFDIINLRNTVATLLYALGTVIVLLLGGGIVAMIAITIPLTLVIQIPTIWLVNRVAPELGYGWRGADSRLVRVVTTYSSVLFVIDLAGQIQNKTDEIVIGITLPIANVAPYAIARRLSEMPQILTDQFMKVLMPLASQLHAEEDKIRLRALYLTSTRLTLVSFVPLACGIFFLARSFLTVWVGAAFAEYTYVVIILTGASLVSTSQWPAGAILQGMGKHRRLAVMTVGAALANLGLSLLLVHPLGLAGVALGTLIPTLVECLCFVLPYAMRVNDVDPWMALTEMFFPALVPIIPMAVVLYSLQELVRPDSFVSIALVGSLSLLVYAVAYLCLGAKSSERQTLHRLTLKMLHIARAHLKRR